MPPAHRARKTLAGRDAVSDYRTATRPNFRLMPIASRHSKLNAVSLSAAPHGQPPAGQHGALSTLHVDFSGDFASSSASTAFLSSWNAARGIIDIDFIAQHGLAGSCFLGRSRYRYYFGAPSHCFKRCHEYQRARVSAYFAESPPAYFDADVAITPPYAKRIGFYSSPGRVDAARRESARDWVTARRDDGWLLPGCFAFRGRWQEKKCQEAEIAISHGHHHASSAYFSVSTPKWPDRAGMTR